jgi:hypothetical protein
MTVAVVARPWGEDRPSEQEIGGAGGGLVDEELDLHVDPTFFRPQTGYSRNSAEVGAERLHHDIPLSR